MHSMTNLTGPTGPAGPAAINLLALTGPTGPGPIDDHVLVGPVGLSGPVIGLTDPPGRTGRAATGLLELTGPTGNGGTWANGPQPEPTPGASQGIPLMITGAMRATLRARGMSDDEIKNLRPEQAWEILESGEPPPEPNDGRVA